MSSPSTALESRRIGALVVVVGLLTLASVALMIGLGGALAPRPGSAYQSPMVEFELALTPAELLAVLDSPATRATLDANNRWDFLFMTLYSLLHAAFFLYAASLNRLRQRLRFRSSAFIYFGFGLAAAMFLGDVLETRQLLSLSAAVTEQDAIQLGLKWLIITTRVKWAALFVASMLLGLATAAYFGRTPGILLSVLFASAGTLGLMSLIHAPARPLCELATTLMALAWVWLLVHAAMTAFRTAKR